MIFDFDYAEAWTTTLTRAVGPTTANARGTLPQPAPTDLNTIFLAKNGSDANPGTSALPKLTVPGAFAATTGILSTVQIIRNGFVGALDFTSGAVTVAAGRNFQVAIGETAKVTFTADFTLGQSFNCNGIEFRFATASDQIILSATSAVNHIFSNCSFYDTNIFTSVNFALSATFNYCLIRGLDCQANGANFNPTFSHCIFPSFNLPTTTAITYEQSGSSSSFSSTVTLDHCILSGQSRSVIDYRVDNSTSSTITVNATLCHLYGMAYALDVQQQGVASQSMTFAATQCLLGIVTNGNVFVGATVGTNAFTQTNPIDPKTPALYTDETGGRAGDASGFRLQWRGKLNSSGQRYFLTSPLIDIQGGSNDATPWDESTALTNAAWSSTYAWQYDPKQLEYVTEFVNPQEIRDVRGNLHTNYDGVRRQITFTWSDYAAPNELRQLIRILQDRSVKRWNPLGTFGSLLFPNLFIAPTSGTWVQSTRTLTVGGTAMIPQNWRGFWLHFLSGPPDDQFFYVESNTTTGLVLLDKLNFGYPVNGTYDFEISHLLVQTSLEALTAATQYYSHWIGGQATRESLINNPTDGSLPLNGFKVTLYEVEDASEGGIS